MANLEKFLICVECGKNLNTKDGVSKIKCDFCGAKIKIEKGKIYFIEIPLDAPKNLNADPANKKYWSNWRRANYEYFRPVLEGLQSDKIFVDIGTGVAQFRELHDKFSTAYTIDFFPYERVNVVSDLNKRLPLADNSCDIVMLSNVLEHIPDTKKLLSECNRILRKGGVLLGAIPFLMRVHQSPYDFNRFTHIMLEKLIHDSDFSNIEVKNLGSSFNVYKTMQFHFFGYLLNTRFSDVIVIDFLLKLFAKVAWYINKILIFFFLPLYGKARSSPDFTEGYGFKALKN